MNVLVIEDQEVQRELLRAVAFLAWQGAQVHTATDLESGLCSAAATRMDVVLLDLGLPGCRGVEAVTSLRAAHPDVPIVVVSSNDQSEVIAQALREGANAFIPKGITPQAMAAVLRGA